MGLVQDLACEHEFIGTEQYLGILLPTREASSWHGLWLGGQDRTGGAWLIALDQVIDVNVSPAASTLVDDLDNRFLAKELGNVPGGLGKFLAAATTVIGTSRCPHYLAVDKQVHAGAAWVLASADQEVDMLALDIDGR